MRISMSDIRGAVARGWCAPKNSVKEMDTDLAEAISQEVVRLWEKAVTPERMSKWQHFLHAFRLHDWHTTKDFIGEVDRKRCGPHDPRSKKTHIDMVEQICCQCGMTREISWAESVGLRHLTS